MCTSTRIAVRRAFAKRFSATTRRDRPRRAYPSCRSRSGGSRNLRTPCSVPSFGGPEWRSLAPSDVCSFPSETPASAFEGCSHSLGESHDKAQATWCCSWRGATMRCGSILGALVTREDAVVVSRHGASQNRAAADADERCRRQSQSASTRILWCGSGGCGRCRNVLQLC